MLVPFVSIVQEIDYLEDLIKRLIVENHLIRAQIKLGIMVEIPSVIWSLPLFLQKVDFLSIGTNDLIQFTVASDREDGRLEEYRKASVPIMLKMINYIVRIAHSFDKEVSVCGEAASDPLIASLLIGTGIRELSVRVNVLQKILKEIESKSVDQTEIAVREYIEAIKGELL